MRRNHKVNAGTAKAGRQAGSPSVRPSEAMLPECPFAALPVRSGFRPGREGSERGRIGREEERRKEEGGAKQREADVDADGRTDTYLAIWGKWYLRATRILIASK